MWARSMGRQKGDGDGVDMLTAAAAAFNYYHEGQGSKIEIGLRNQKVSQRVMDWGALWTR